MSSKRETQAPRLPGAGAAIVCPAGRVPCVLCQVAGAVAACPVLPAPCVWVCGGREGCVWCCESRRGVVWLLCLVLAGVCGDRKRLVLAKSLPLAHRVHQEWPWQAGCARQLPCVRYRLCC